MQALYNLCKVAKERQAEASAAGICPVLTRLVVQRKSIAPAPSEFLSSMSLDSQVSTAVDNRISVAIRAVCIRLLCILAHSNARTRDQLWMCQGVDIFMDLRIYPGFLEKRKQSLHPFRMLTIQFAECNIRLDSCVVDHTRAFDVAADPADTPNYWFASEDSY